MINKYSQEYIDQCRSKVDQQLGAYQALVAAGGDQKESGAGKFSSALESFEPLFFNNLVLVLDGYFTDRSRTIEGKDGNPLNEVRVLCNSMLNYDNILKADKTIKLNPDKTVLKHQVGDAVRLKEADFRQLSKAFF